MLLNVLAVMLIMILKVNVSKLLFSLWLQRFFS